MNQQHPGQRVTVTLHFPEGTVTAVSEVVYSLANQGFGLRFVSILPDSASVLDAALERLGGPGR